MTREEIISKGAPASKPKKLRRHMKEVLRKYHEEIGE